MWVISVLSLQVIFQTATEDDSDNKCSTRTRRKNLQATVAEYTGSLLRLPHILRQVNNNINALSDPSEIRGRCCCNKNNGKMKQAGKKVSSIVIFA